MAFSWLINGGDLTNTAYNTSVLGAHPPSRVPGSEGVAYVNDQTTPPVGTGHPKNVV